MIRNVTARLVETPGTDHPYKVVVTREDTLIAEVSVSSEIAGMAMIKHILEGGDQSTLFLE